MQSIKGNENLNAMSPFLVFFIVVILINIFFINNFCKMGKLISRILIPEKFNLVKIWKKKIFCDFDICSFIFFYLGFMQFYALAENIMVYIVCNRCPKIACSRKTSLWRIWDTNIKNDIPSFALVTYKMI